jgi:ribosomal protein L32
MEKEKKEAQDLKAAEARSTCEECGEYGHVHKDCPEKVVDGRLSYQSSYGFASRQIPRRSQGTLLPSSGEPKVSNPWNNVQHKDSI